MVYILHGLDEACIRVYCGVVEEDDEAMELWCRNLFCVGREVLEELVA